jgi:hypothetical protein
VGVRAPGFERFGPDRFGRVSGDGCSDAIAPIFVVGAGRSGTTLLRLMLNEHPCISIPSESHFVVPLVLEFGPTAQLSDETLARAVDLVAASVEWQRDFGHSLDELRAFVGTQPMSLAAFIDRVFRLEVGPDAVRWGDKTPANLHYVDQLLECFPDAQVIAIVRDPRDVYLSLAPLGWFGDTTWAIGRYLARNGELLRKWLAHCPSTRFRVVRYEDLVLDTERVLGEVCKFLSVPFVPEMTEFHRSTADHVQPWELDSIHQKLLRPPAAADVERWRVEGSRRDRVEIEALTVDVIRDWGYESTLGALGAKLVRSECRIRHHTRAPGALARRSAAQLRRRTRRLLTRRSVRGSSG